MNYRPQPAAVQSILMDVLGADALLAGLGPFADADADLMRQVLEEGGRFVSEVIGPLNTVGDNPGCQFAAGKVTMPPGFRDAYQAFWQAGWPALSASVEDGGQGLPAVLECVLYEWLSASNHGWTMAPGLLHGAYECIRHHADAELKARYVRKIATGEWLATMCLTEPHAGSDLGLVRTRGVPQPDGSYRISGTKIFISGGEHDLTDNIIHLVLGRLPEAPSGPKGLSLFLVPKFMPNGLGNAAFCDRIEEKMGLHGSPTCVMRFDEATGWLIGEPGRGLSAMFVMMNAARLHVALQGIGLLDAAWQKADAYARERRQMRAPGAAQIQRGNGHHQQGFQPLSKSNQQRLKHGLPRLVIKKRVMKKPPEQSLNQPGQRLQGIRCPGQLQRNRHGAGRRQQNPQQAAKTSSLGFDVKRKGQTNCYDSSSFLRPYPLV